MVITKAPEPAVPTAAPISKTPSPAGLTPHSALFYYAEYARKIHGVEPVSAGRGISFKHPTFGEIRVDASGAYTCSDTPSVRGAGVLELWLQETRKSHADARSSLIEAGVIPARAVRAHGIDAADLAGSVGVASDVSDGSDAGGLLPYPTEVIRCAKIERENLLARRSKTLPSAQGYLELGAIGKLKDAKGDPLMVYPLNGSHGVDGDPVPATEAAGIEPQPPVWGAKLGDWGCIAVAFNEGYMANGPAVVGEDDPYKEEGDALSRVREIQRAIAISLVCRKHAVAYALPGRGVGDWCWHVLYEGEAPSDDLWMRTGLFAWPAPWVEVLGSDVIVPLCVRSRPRAKPELFLSTPAREAMGNPRVDEIGEPPEEDAYRMRLTSPLFRDEED